MTALVSDGSIEAGSCIAVLEDLFGPIASAVGGVLLNETLPLPLIYHRLGHRYKLIEVKKAVALLVQHGVVQFALDVKHHITYEASTVEIIRLVRSARCVLAIKTLYGDMAEAICEEIVSQGRIEHSEIIRRVSTRFENQNSEVGQMIAKLAEARFIVRCPRVINTSHGCPQFEKNVDSSAIPECAAVSSSQTMTISDDGNGSRKRKLINDENEQDAKILWKLNYERFERYLRDEMIVDLCTSTNTSFKCMITVLRALLKICELKTKSLTASSTPISVHDILRTVNSSNSNLDRHGVEVALRLLSEDGSGIIRKVGDSAGGLFVVDFERATVLQCERLVESCIMERFDRRAVRIYKLLLQRGHLEEDQIEKLAMLPSREAREICCQLVRGKYVTITHVAKTNDFAPARTFYLYNINLNVVAHTLYLHIYKALRNVLIRRAHETKENKVLIDRQLKMETITANIEADENLDDAAKDQQVTEVEEMYLTAGDRNILERYKKGQTALFNAEAKLEHDILVLSTYLDFVRRRV